MQPWARSVESDPNPDALQLAPRSPTWCLWPWLPRQAWTGHDAAHRRRDPAEHSARLREESAGLSSCVGHEQPSQARPQGTVVPSTACTGTQPQPRIPLSLTGLGQLVSPRPCMHHAAHRPQLADLPCPPHQTPAMPTAGPHLLGLSLRLVLRALKLSFSGVSSKDRRTLERRPCRVEQT